MNFGAEFCSKTLQPTQKLITQ